MYSLKLILLGFGGKCLFDTASLCFVNSFFGVI